MEFDWDDKKAASNFEDHTVSFSEAETVFGDPLARIFEDDEHSFDEKRHSIFGHSDINRILIVSFTERGSDTIRIISARLAKTKERRRYAN